MPKTDPMIYEAALAAKPVCKAKAASVINSLPQCLFPAMHSGAGRPGKQVPCFPDFH